MSISSIKAWLQVRGAFATGVELLKVHGRPSSADLFIYGLGETSVSRARLVDQLSALVDPAVERTAAATEALSGQPGLVLPTERANLRAVKDDNRQDIRDEDLPPQLRPIRQQIRADFRLLSMLRGEALRIPDGFELRKVALHITELHDKLRAGWLVIETWRDTGTVIPFESAAEKDRAALFQERASLRSQLSPNRIKARNTPPEKVEAWRRRLAEIDQLLDEPVRP